jgi:membrane-associated PAP2 superfamily phosphatase
VIECKACERVHLFPVLLLIVICSYGASAQTVVLRGDTAAGVIHVAALQNNASTVQDEYLPSWYAMFTNIPGNWARYAGMTFREETIPAMVGMTVLTGGLFATDQETWRLSDRLYKGSHAAKQLSDFFEYLGDGKPQFGLAAGFAVYGFAAGDRRALRTASQTVEAILSCGVVIQALKHITGRESPFLSTRTGGRWDFFPNQIEYHKHVPQYDAYPSGHIATALATVTVVAENYPELWWVRPVGYVVVGLIGVSMANTGIHWYSDYPLGLALGYGFGMLAAHPEAMGGLGNLRPAHGAHMTLTPLITQERAGLEMTLSF